MGKRAAVALVVVWVLAGCAANISDRHLELTVGSTADAESVLLAEVYAAALRSYGFAARAEITNDPLATLSLGAVTAVPVFTGRMLQALQPDAAVLSDKQVYQAMVAALPEGIAAGDYATAAQSKSALVVTYATAQAWGGSDLSELPRHCGGLAVGAVGAVGAVAGARPPAAVGSCRLPVPREFPDDTAMWTAVRANELTAAWTTTANPDNPADLVVLVDGTPALIRAENVVPLYRRNTLSDRQLLAINEVAGVLDTAALVEMRRQVFGGAPPQQIAGEWLAQHPLGR